MFDFHEKRKIRRILYSKLSIVVLFLFAAWFSTAVYERYTVSQDMKQRLDDKYVELESLEQRAETIKTKVDYLKDERGVEEELRNRFDVAKEGEQVVIILDSEEGKNDDSITVDEEEKEIQSFFEKIQFWR